MGDLFLLADNTPDAGTIGLSIQVLFYFAGSLCAVVIALSTVYATFFKKRTPQPDAEYLTRGEFDRCHVDLRNQLVSDLQKIEFRVEQRIKESSERAEKSMQDRMDSLESEVKDGRKRFHDLRNNIHAVNLRLVWMMSLMTQLAEKSGISIPPIPSISVQDEA